MIKVNLAYQTRSPRGGSPWWVHEFKLFNDDEKAEVIEAFIDNYKKSDSESGYKKYFQVENIERI